MTDNWLLVVYLAGAVATALIMGRRMVAWVMGEFPDSDQCQGGFHPEAGDVLLLAFTSVLWPLGLPIGLILIHPPRRGGPPGALTRIIFGRLTASNGGPS